MKKIASSILAILLCASMLASCGKVVTPPQNITDDIASIATDATEDKATESETAKEEPKDETPKDETPKDETPKDETPKDETPKDETPKDETPKEEEPTIDPSRIVNVTPTNFAARFSLS